MTPEQRQRAGKAVEERIDEMGSTASAIARMAGLDGKTLRALVRGEHWPADSTQSRLEQALGWQPGEFHARSVRGGPDGALSMLADVEIAAELLRRLAARQRAEARTRALEHHRK